MNILYIGPNDSEWAQENRPVSLAAAKWSRGLLTALSKIATVTALTHTTEIAWPKGDVFWRGYDERLYPQGWETVSISYPVLKVVREWWWRFAYVQAVWQILHKKRIDVVLFYNCYEPWKLPVMRAIKELNVPVVPIILDGDDPRKDNWQWMSRAARYADGFVPLSWWVYRNCPCGLPMYHMDGGADGWQGGLPKDEPNKPFTLVHTGSLDKWRGLDIMIRVIQGYAKPGVKFILCGKESQKELHQLLRDNAQVELTGFLSEERMKDICNQSDALLNVRDPQNPDNILNYPSKLPHYLSFGRPIVSTHLESLSPDYRDVIEFAEDDTVASYLKKLDEVRTWTLAKKIQKYETIERWFGQRKRWDLLAGGLVDWLNRKVLKAHP